MSERANLHMTPEEFRLWGHRVVDWVASYMERVESLPVLSQVKPGEVRARLPQAPPEDGESFDKILADLDSVILPGITHWQSPNFFAYFPANSSGPSILGDLVASGLGVQGMLWSTSPASTELETHVLDWLARMLALPEKFLSSGSGGGVIQDSGSSANLCAVLAAREAATGFVSNRKGVSGRITAYASAQTHSSVEKALKVAGMGSENLRLVGHDESYAMRPELVEEAVVADRKAGFLPAIVVANVGSTSCGALDPLRAIGELCRTHGLWLHVDAAYAGSAAVCPELRFIHEGLELADSYCFNPHKWLLTNFDCDCFYVADRRRLIGTLAIDPEYLKNKASASGQVIDYRDWHVPLGRRFRALKLWFVIRHYGVQGLQRHIRAHVEAARTLEERIAADLDFELAARRHLSLVCFRHRGGDAVNQRILDRLNASGEAFITHTRLGGRLTLRMAIGGTYTQPHHVEQAWRRIREIAVAEGGRLEASPGGPRTS
jgi:aromatic-L-amino-acid decarboxylase